MRILARDKEELQARVKSQTHCHDGEKLRNKVSFSLLLSIQFICLEGFIENPGFLRF